MHLVVDIQQKADPAIQSMRKIRFFNGFLKDLVLPSLIQQTNKKLGVFILISEGLSMHINELSDSEAKDLYNNVRFLIKRFDDFDRGLKQIDYAENVELKTKLRYSLKTLYKIEARTHKKLYQDSKQFESFDSELKLALSSLNIESLGSKLLMNWE